MMLKFIKVVTVGESSNVYGKDGNIFFLRTLSGSKAPNHVPFDNYLLPVTFKKNTSITLTLSDTRGQEEYDNLRQLVYANTNLFIVTFSLNDPSSFEKVCNKWLPEIQRFCPQVPFVLVGFTQNLISEQAFEKALPHEQGKQCIGYVTCDPRQLNDVKKAMVLGLEGVENAKKRVSTGISGNWLKKSITLQDETGSIEPENLQIPLKKSASASPAQKQEQTPERQQSISSKDDSQENARQEEDYFSQAQQKKKIQKTVSFAPAVKDETPSSNVKEETPSSHFAVGKPTGSKLAQRLEALQHSHPEQHAPAITQTPAFKREMRNVDVSKTRQQLLALFQERLAQQLRTNAGYTRAQQELSNQSEKKAQFDKTYQEATDEIMVNMQNDVQRLNAGTLTMPKDMTDEEFFHLSFLYHSYERTLALNNIRLTANQEKLVSDTKSEAMRRTEIALNYYEDFFTRLSRIEQVSCWSNAGEKIRGMEVMFFYGQEPQCLVKKIQYRGNEDAATVVTKILDTYTQTGDGLNKERHPYTRFGYERLPQPNKPLNTTTTAATWVQQKVDADTTRQRSFSKSPRNGVPVLPFAVSSGQRSLFGEQPQQTELSQSAAPRSHAQHSLTPSPTE